MAEVRVFQKEEISLKHSQQIENYTQSVIMRDDLAAHPDSRTALLEYIYFNTTHAACISTKSTCVGGLGYSFKDEKKVKPFIDFLNRQVDRNGDPISGEQIFSGQMWDWEAFGEGGFEIVRFGKEPEQIYQANPVLTYLKKDRSCYYQVSEKEQKSVQFARYGDSSKNLNEMIFLRQASKKSSYYPLPKWYACLGDMTISKLSQNYNLKFYDNNLSVDMALIVSGGKLTKEGLQTVKDHLAEKKGVGGSHGVLYIPVTGKEGAQVKVELKKLESLDRDGAFIEERYQNKISIAEAHQTPLGLVSSEKAGGIQSGEMSTGAMKLFNQLTLRPRRMSLIKFWERFARTEWGIEDLGLQFTDLDLTNEKQVAETEKIIAETMTAYKQNKDITSFNEWRKKVGKREYTEKEFQDFIREI